MEEEPKTIEEVLEKYAALSVINAFMPFIMGTAATTLAIDRAMKREFSKTELEEILKHLEEAFKACKEILLLQHLKIRIAVDLKFIRRAINQKSNEHQGDQSDPK